MPKIIHLFPISKKILLYHLIFEMVLNLYLRVSNLQGSVSFGGMANNKPAVYF